MKLNFTRVCHRRLLKSVCLFTRYNHIVIPFAVCHCKIFVDPQKFCSRVSWVYGSPIGNCCPKLLFRPFSFVFQKSKNASGFILLKKTLVCSELDLFLCLTITV